MFKVTMINEAMDASVVVNEVKSAWELIAPVMPTKDANIHIEDTETGEVIFLFQEGEIKHMEPTALTGFLDMVYDEDPMLAMFMALDLLANLDKALGA